MMKKTIEKIIEEELKSLGREERVLICKRFFKTGKGEYGEGDIFMGVTVPATRGVLRRHVKELALLNAINLLQSKYHEMRLIGVLTMVGLMKKAIKQDDKKSQKEIIDAYLKSAKRVNSWDLVDISARDIVGCFVFDKNRDILYRLAQSKNLWERRIAIISTWYFIKQGDPNETFKICSLLLKDKEDLIHKACGWMLREVGKYCGEETLNIFLEKNRGQLPRVTLRYALEKHHPIAKAKFLAQG